MTKTMTAAMSGFSASEVAVMVAAVAMLVIVGGFVCYLIWLYFQTRALEAQIERHYRHIYAGIDDVADCLICKIEHAQFPKLDDEDKRGEE